MKKAKTPKGRGGGRNKTTSKPKVSAHPEQGYIALCLHIPSSHPRGTGRFAKAQPHPWRITLFCCVLSASWRCLLAVLSSWAFVCLIWLYTLRCRDTQAVILLMHHFWQQSWSLCLQVTPRSCCNMSVHTLH